MQMRVFYIVVVCVCAIVCSLFQSIAFINCDERRRSIESDGCLNHRVKSICDAKITFNIVEVTVCLGDICVLVESF